MLLVIGYANIGECVLVDTKNNAVTNETALGDIDMAKGMLIDLKDAIAPDYAMVSNAAKSAASIEQLATATNSIVGLSTNAAIKATSTLFRPLGDEQVYVSLGYSDFTYECDRQEVLDAIGDSQPYISYESGDYCEWYINFNIGNTNYSGYAYVPKNAPEVTFSCDGWSWNDETGEESYDSVQVIGKRKANGYDIQDPIDTFAHQSELTTIHAKMTSISNLVNGEVKVLRTGQLGECGSGYGYIMTQVNSNEKLWHLRVPHWQMNESRGNPEASRDVVTIDGDGYDTRNFPLWLQPAYVRYNINNGTTNSYNRAATWYTWDGYTESNRGNGNVKLFPARNWSFYPNLEIVRHEPYITRGIRGTDGVAECDFDIKVWWTATNVMGSTDHALTYSIVHSNNATYARGHTDGLVRVVGSAASGWFMPIDIPPMSGTNSVDYSKEVFREQWYSGPPNYITSNANPWRVIIVATNIWTEQIKAIGFTSADLANMKPYASYPYSSIPFTYISDLTCRLETWQQDPETMEITHTVVLDNVTFTNRIASTSIRYDKDDNTYDELYIPYYRFVTTLEPYNHMYYDPMADATYKISLYNGVYLSEKQCDGDWRNVQGVLAPTNDIEIVVRGVEAREQSRIEALESEVTTLTNSVIQLQTINQELTDRLSGLESAIHSITNNAN